MKALHTKGGLWPPQESCYLEGVCDRNYLAQPSWCNHSPPSVESSREV